MKQNSYHQPYSEDEQINLQENSMNAYRQNEKLFSKDDCSLQKEETLSKINSNKYPDGTRVLQVDLNVVLDIPDNYLGLDLDSQQDMREHNSYIESGYLSEKHRKEQLTYLNGKLPKDHK